MIRSPAAVDVQPAVGEPRARGRRSANQPSTSGSRAVAVGAQQHRAAQVDLAVGRRCATSTPSSGTPSYTTPLPVSVMPYVVTTFGGQVGRRRGAAEDDRAERAPGRCGAARWRTSDTWRRARRAVDDRRRRSRAARSSACPCTSARVTTASPPTWASGRQASQWSSLVDAEPVAASPAPRRATASWVSTTPFGAPVEPLVATTSASPGSTGRAAVERRSRRVPSTTAPTAIARQQRPPGGVRAGAGRRGTRRRRGPRLARSASTNAGPPGRSRATRRPPACHRRPSTPRSCGQLPRRARIAPMMAGP